MQKIIINAYGVRMAIECVMRKDGENQGTNTMKALKALVMRSNGVRR